MTVTVTLVVSIKSILLLCSTTYEKTTWASNNKFFHKNHYTKHVDQVEV